MAINNYFSHVGSNNSTLQDRAQQAGFLTFPLGENIAAGYNSVLDTALAWMWCVHSMASVSSAPVCQQILAWPGCGHCHIIFWHSCASNLDQSHPEMQQARISFAL